MTEFDILGFSPFVILLVLVGVFLFLKIMKYALVIAVVAGVFLAWKLGWIPGLG